MAGQVLLKDQLFNVQTVQRLAQEYAQAVSQFNAARFEKEALSGFAERELLARLEWLADCAAAQLPADFPAMADALEAAMPHPLDPTRTDDDFGHFIHAVPGILAVRHGLEAHRSRAMDLVYAATQRFSMEFYIRPFLNRWPDETLAALRIWAGDDNYHVRRLVSEGTRPKLPWAKSITTTPDQTLPLLDMLHADPTRYVTRSVANHLNDLSKSVPDLVLQRLSNWRKAGLQSSKELDWMTRHALRTMIKSGHPGAMDALGFYAGAQVDVAVTLVETTVQIGHALEFECIVSAPEDTLVLVDYRLSFARPAGKTGQKVFKLKQGKVSKNTPLKLHKRHKLKADATTFTWHPGPHSVTIQVNGVDRAHHAFDVI